MNEGHEPSAAPNVASPGRFARRLALAVGVAVFAVCVSPVFLVGPVDGAPRSQTILGALALAAFLAFLAYALVHRVSLVRSRAGIGYTREGRRRLRVAYAVAALASAWGFGSAAAASAENLAVKALVALVLLALLWSIIWLASPVLVRRMH